VRTPEPRAALKSVILSSFTVARPCDTKANRPPGPEGLAGRHRGSTSDIPQVLRVYQEGSIKLDELITRRYSLDDAAQGYEDMHADINIRGIVTF
jgi:hypothetical protein